MNTSSLRFLGECGFETRRCIVIVCLNIVREVDRNLMGFWFTGFGRLVVGKRSSVSLE